MKIPLVVLTGFLGAGKTSLLNRVIAARAAADVAGGKLAIIVNELGAIGIDADLLPQGAARQVELPGGCVCCVLADDLDRTVAELLDANPEVDTLVLETTGVAEPIPIVWTLERPPLDARVRVAAIVTVVDPTSWPEARATSTVAEVQVESADVVIITKLDLADPPAVAQVRADVATLAPHAPIVAATPGQAAAWLLALLGDPPERGHRAGREPHEHEPHEHPHPEHEPHEHEPPEHEHPEHEHPAHEHHAHAHARVGVGHGVASAALPIAEVLDLEVFEDALAGLPVGFFRVKAIVLAVDPRRGGVRGWHAVHRVGGRVSSEPIATPAGGARIVGLGPAVGPEPLAACVAAAVLGSPTG